MSRTNTWLARSVIILYFTNLEKARFVQVVEEDELSKVPSSLILADGRVDLSDGVVLIHANRKFDELGKDIVVTHFI